mgnify:CR=1 FL=1
MSFEDSYGFDFGLMQAFTPYFGVTQTFAPTSGGDSLPAFLPYNNLSNIRTFGVNSLESITRANASAGKSFRDDGIVVGDEGYEKALSFVLDREGRKFVREKDTGIGTYCGIQQPVYDE